MRRFVAIWWVAGAVACGASGAAGEPSAPLRPWGREDPFSGITLVESTVELSRPSAAQYGAQADDRLSEMEEAIVRMLANSPMTHDPGLSMMSRELARTAPGQGQLAPPRLVAGLMAWARVAGPVQRFKVVDRSPDPHQCHASYSIECQETARALADQVAAAVPGTGVVHFGVGVAAVPPDTTRMVVAIQRVAVELDPVPAVLRPGQSVRLSGRLVGDRSDPRVEIIDADGRGSSAPIRVGPQGDFAATVVCEDDVRGPMQVEVLAEGEHGSEVAANFPMYCGVDPPTTLTVLSERLDASVTAEQVAYANFAYLNEERTRRGLPALRWSDRAAEIARSHSLDMKRNGFFGHRSPRTGDMGDRYRRAGFEVVRLRENLAQNYGPQLIHDDLMASPGHRLNILATDVTHVGIGVVESAAAGGEASRRTFFCTQNFFRLPEADAPPDRRLVSELKHRIDGRREERGQAPVDWVEQLERAARTVGRAAVRDKPLEPGWDAALGQLAFGRYSRHLWSSEDFSALADIDLWSTPDLHAGLFVVRTKEDGRSEFTVAVVVGEP